MERFYSEICLMEQPFIKDPEKKISDVLKEAITRLRENIEVRRFARLSSWRRSSKELATYIKADEQRAAEI